LFRQLFPLNNASKEDTEEIIQEIFLKVWENRELLPAIQSFQAYVFRMGRNIMVTQFRKKTVRQRAAHELSQQSAATQGADDILFIEYHAIAREAIHRLPPRQRQIFELRTQHDLSLNEIAAYLGISLAAVKKQLYAAIDSIKTYLRKHAGWLIGLLLFFFRR
jgi:RNA polymerase sigma-70 factor (ECF subfamily)